MLFLISTVNAYQINAAHDQTNERLNNLIYLEGR